ncbi:MAG: hypothetical protein HC902_00735 [Calothrix sp. SM1_5_4]|nr:hypothetical protein [Calothrix sp. SM1_5_4]
MTRELTSERTTFGVFFASGSKTARWLATLPPDLKAKLIVVNCNHHGEIDDQQSFMSVFNMNTYVTDSGTWLAELLNSPPEIRTPAGETEDVDQKAPVDKSGESAD